MKLRKKEMRNKEMLLKLLKRKIKIQDQFDYFEHLGGHPFYSGHKLTYSRLNDTEERETQQIETFSEKIERIRQDLCTEFGIIDLKDYPLVSLWEKLPSPPLGKIYYLDWYKEIKKKYNKIAYKGLICSSCPYSKGVEGMDTDIIPCGLINGVIYLLEKPYLCRFIDHKVCRVDFIDNKYPESAFLQKIEKEHGKKAPKKFIKKQKKLKRLFEQLNEKKGDEIKE